MAVGSTAVWRVRVSGVDTNGGGYDAGIAGAATDYSQQDAAQATSATGTTTGATAVLIDAAALFTAAMIGNAVNISAGTNFTVGFYFITGFTNTTTVTLDRNCATGVGAGGTYSVGGGFANIKTNITQLVPGNVVFIRGAGTDTPSSADYTSSGFFTPPAGDQVNGTIRWIGENGRPWIATAGLMFYNAAYHYFENLLFVATATTNTNTFGLCGAMIKSTFRNVVFDQGGKDVPLLSGGMAGVSVVDCEFYTSSAVAGATQPALDVSQNPYGASVLFCNIHDCGLDGIKAMGDSAVIIANNIIAKNGGNGITVGTTTGSYAVTILNNTIDGNVGDGINIASTAALNAVRIIMNNIISNQSGVGKYGINVAAGAAATNTRMVGFEGYNDFFNNTLNYHNLNSGQSSQVGEQTLDPQYAAQSTEGYNIGANLKALGFPVGAFRQHKASQTATQSYIDIGGVQRAEAGGAGGGSKLIGGTLVGA